MQLTLLYNNETFILTFSEHPVGIIIGLVSFSMCIPKDFWPTNVIILKSVTL